MPEDRWIPEQEDPDVQYCESLERLESHVKAQNLPDICSRKWSSRRVDGGDDSITVLQFNVLAEGLSAPPNEVKAPPHPAAKDSMYGGFEGVLDAAPVFDWRHRKFQILREILQHHPDVVALEEVDHWKDFFEPVMKQLGYDRKWACI